MGGEMLRRVATEAAYELVCPDGAVRHFRYYSAVDAESDAALAEQQGCRFYAKPSRLERAFGPCPGGAHSVRLEGRP